MAIRSCWGNIRITHRFFGTSFDGDYSSTGVMGRPLGRRDSRFCLSFPSHSVRFVVAVLALCLSAFTVAAQSKAHKPAHKSSAKRAEASRNSASLVEQQLEQLARELHDKPTGDVYQRLSAFAQQQSKSPLRARAALALGYYDYTRNHFPEAREWLRMAAADPLLADYALLYQGLNDRSSGAQDAALEELQRFRARYPDSVMSDSAVAALAQSAIATNRPDLAISALNAYPKTQSKPQLILLRAQASEKLAVANNEMPLAASNDYLDVTYRFPLSDEAKIASDKVSFLRLQIGEQVPGTPVQNEIARAEAFYDAKRWRDMRDAYQELLPKLSGMSHDLAMLRIAQADFQTGVGSQALAQLVVADPEVDAQRMYVLANALQTSQGIDSMLTAIDELVAKYPQSTWAEQGLFAAGNYYWANMDREHAVEYYQRDFTAFPAGRNAAVAQWRVAWTAYLDRQPDAGSQFEQFLRQNPRSSYAVDALYWIGRCAEQALDLQRARAFYLAAQSRFPQTYFAERSGDRLREIGRAPAAQVDLIAVIPPAVKLAPFTDALPDAALPQWQRAQALESISFNASAELELRADYAETQAPKLLLAVAQAAESAGSYPQGVVATRQLVPELEARQFSDVPLDVWRAAYPLPYLDSLSREANRNHLDPMLVAGLVRQESLFQPNAVSYTGCCLGLMQVLPATGVKLARGLKVRFARSQLFDPDYNLRLGTYYLANLFEMYGTPEEVVAAYNAGETRVDSWTLGHPFREPPEFVESIPFTQTRDYVQIVLRNAELYRRIYTQPTKPQPAPAKAPIAAGKAVANRPARGDSANRPLTKG